MHSMYIYTLQRPNMKAAKIWTLYSKVKAVTQVSNNWLHNMVSIILYNKRNKYFSKTVQNKAMSISVKSKAVLVIQVNKWRDPRPNNKKELDMEYSGSSQQSSLH